MARDGHPNLSADSIIFQMVQASLVLIDFVPSRNLPRFWRAGDVTVPSPHARRRAGGWLKAVRSRSQAGLRNVVDLASGDDRYSTEQG
jgi:hypothetical protein